MGSVFVGARAVVASARPNGPAASKMTPHSITSRHFGMLRPAALAVLAGMLLSACGGGGGGGGGNPPPANVTISGRITFSRIPFDVTLDNGLNPAATVALPAREVTVQAIDASNQSVLATAVTDGNGNYSVSVPSNRNLFIRARAEMVKTGTAPTWNFSVRNNANSDALYAVDGDAASSGAANGTRDLNAPTGFGTTTYTGVRAAAPFAILDTVFSAKQLVLGATPGAVFPALSLFWSEQNRPTAGRFCPDDGDIGTSSYIVFSPNELDQCTVAKANPDGIYILGNFSVAGGDTDEFDQSVIAHEFGHYLEDRFARSDSIGGLHGRGDLLDLRVAFSEGWGNAFSSMALGDPIYRDSSEGTSFDFQIDMEGDDQLNEGWFSEGSVEEILWDVFDPANEPGDTVALGFTPIFNVMTGAVASTDAVTSIFPFASALRAANATSQAGIGNLLDQESIFGTDDFGGGESNDGSDANVLPVYRAILLNTPISVCSRSPDGNDNTNKLGNRVFLRFDNNVARLVAIQVDGAANGSGTTFATDPDVFVLRKGALVAVGLDTPAGPPPHTTAGHETIEPFQVAAGTSIIEVYDFELDRVVGTQPRCMTVSVTGS